ncbi:MAG: hypothetical protein ACOX2M_02800 [Fastidiosipilaceae bacterium]|jgi:hypothetical protein
MHTFETILTVPLVILLTVSFLGELPGLYRNVSERAAQETKACVSMLRTEMLYELKSTASLHWVITHPPRMLRFQQQMEDLVSWGDKQFDRGVKGGVGDGETNYP